MKKIQLASFIVLGLTLAGMALWRLAVPFTDWLVRLDGVLMLAALFTSAFTTARIALNKK